MNDNWSIRKVEGGFIVETYSNVAPPPGQENMVAGCKRTERVFPDSASLINFLHNELVGSN